MENSFRISGVLMRVKVLFCDHIRIRYNETGTSETIREVVKHCPDCFTIWLMRKNKWKTVEGHVDGDYFSQKAYPYYGQ